MKQLFIIALAVCVVLAASLGVLLFISLMPYFDVIGKVAAGVVMVGLGCTAILLIVGTYSIAGSLLAKRRRDHNHASVIEAGDVVVYLQQNGDILHLSAQHEAAKVPPQMLLPEKTVEATAEESTVLELYEMGNSLRDIAKSTGMTYYQVQKICSKVR